MAQERVACATAAVTSPGAPGAPDAAAVMSRAAGENFPVASRLLPRGQREHLLALYGFARLVDDIGDEGPLTTARRLELLDRVDTELDAIYAGALPEHPLLRRLGETVAACALPAAPLRALVQANRQDQVKATYDTYEELVAYCALSANPVGRLVLHVFGAVTPRRVARSDAVCTALQLTEHWQDVAEDADRGRVYLPRRDLERFGCPESDLRARAASPGLRALMAFEIARARELFDSGAPLVHDLPLRPALAVGAFVAGGRAALDAIERVDGDVIARRPRPTGSQRLRALASTLARPRRS
jgi:squalene synthase HpnC